MASAEVITGKASASAGSAPVPGVPANVDPVFYAQLKFRRRQYEPCIDICTELLQRNPYDRVSRPGRSTASRGVPCAEGTRPGAASRPRQVAAQPRARGFWRSFGPAARARRSPLVRRLWWQARALRGRQRRPLG